MKFVDVAINDVRTDYTWNRVGRLAVQGARALPRGTAHYAIDKFPIIGWLPRYNPRWLVNDLIAGLTIGLMLIPQGLSYAKIAKIPVEYGLQASWLPPLLYTLMGSTKDLSTGPTSLIGLMTSEAVTSIQDEGYTPQAIAAAVAMCMGIMGMAIGFLQLGFLLEFISLPILSGFISAVAITIGLNQMASLLGETKVTATTAAAQIRQILRQLPNANGYACAVGFTGILFLVILEQAGKRLKPRNVILAKTLWFLSIMRAFLTLLLFTGVSYAVNKDRGKKTLFDIVKVSSSGILKPEVPSGTLIGKAFPRAIPAFIGGVLEHVAIARAFGVKNNYVADQTQEVTYFGVANFVNSFFHPMGVGGAMSRTSVNSMCNVRSPLSGVVQTTVILVCIYKLTDALYWIPKATLAAIIICAVAPLVRSPKEFYGYWKTSLADFISAMLAFWVCLFVSTYEGLAAAVGFNIVYILLRQVFTRMTTIGAADRQAVSRLSISLETSRGLPPALPDDVRIFRFHDSFFFVNAYRLKTTILDIVQTYHTPAYSNRNGAEAERNWSVQRDKHVARLRRRANVSDPNSLPPISIVVLDFFTVSYMDSTAVTNLRNLIKELKLYGGSGVEVRFVGIADNIRTRLERARLSVVEEHEFDEGDHSDDVLRLYSNLSTAVLTPRRVDVVMLEKDVDKAEHVEGMA